MAARLVTVAAVILAVLSGCMGDDGSDGATAGSPGGTFATKTTGQVCAVSPAMAQGPYYLDLEPQRSDIREAEAGTLLRLDITVQQRQGTACVPLAGATVNIWHANATGIYSGITGEGTKGMHFLRGWQTTDANGTAHFTTIWPGWYPGRSVHIHVKVTHGGSDFTSQFFASDADTLAVYGAAPYRPRGPPDTDNAHDSIYAGEGGDRMLLRTVAAGGTWVGTKTVVVP